MSGTTILTRVAAALGIERGTDGQRSENSEDADCSAEEPAEEQSPDTSEDQPCAETGHSWEHEGLDAFHSQGVPHFGSESSFTIVRKDWYECRKCGRSRWESEQIGEVEVDPETNELTIVDN